MIEEMLEHLSNEYPKEGCGIILNRRGKLEWVPCKNVSQTPEETFEFDAREYTRVQLKGDIHAIVHSHPDTTSEPSESDRRASDFLGIPYYIFSIPDGELTVYEPTTKRAPLLGREYVFGSSDCYSLVCDYYRDLEIELPRMPFIDDFWEKGINYFDDLQEEYGFVTVEKPQKHDLVFFNVMSVFPNHCGVYVGEDIFLHHAVNRLSCRESIHSFWGKYITRYVRWHEFI
jgi:proteasome lid subunit RPN8/RPN11